MHQSVSSAAQQAARSGPLFVVLNGGSGRGGADERVEVLSRVFEAAGRTFEFLPVSSPDHISAVATKAVRRAKAEKGVVVAAGGDGTLNAVAQAVLGSGCPYGVLPQGTFNYFGRAHGISQDIEVAAEALLRASVEPVQVGVVNGRVFLVNGSLGLYPRLLEDREAYKQQLGRSRWVALFSGLKTLMHEHRRLDLLIENGGDKQRLRTATLFVGNNALQFERLGMDAAAEALGRGELAAVALRPIGTLPMLGLALRGVLGQLGEAENLTRFTFRRLSVKTRRPRMMKVATDGEIYRLKTPLVFEVASDPLLLLVPCEADRVAVA
ncbi:diacylglycerol/lipid kinase family protein [Polycyclovorans algicola]|uniref:diacylglycerol/lipid kinase family protein n=1 Tax=Polycyclovorans algicola TaxID=616992 RepID=UPI0004A746A9|nr:diacylglycerol kinase family protein [Polycyclovorans algicola]